MINCNLACGAPVPPIWSALARPRPGNGEPLQAATQAASGLLALPFDVLRAQYGSAVELGLIQRSMLAGRDFEQALGALERLSLGCFARRV